MTAKNRLSDGVVAAIFFGAVAVAAAASAFAFALCVPGHPYKAIALGVAALFGWSMGSLDDEAEHPLSLIRLGISAVGVVALTAIWGIAGLVAAVILSAIWAAARVLSGGEDGPAVVFSILLLLLLSWYKSQLGL